MIKTFFKLLFGLGKEIEVFTSVRDGLENVYAKSKHKGIVKLGVKGFYLQNDEYKVPLWVDLSVDRAFGLETKYVIK